MGHPDASEGGYGKPLRDNAGSPDAGGGYRQPMRDTIGTGGGCRVQIAIERHYETLRRDGR